MGNYDRQRIDGLHIGAVTALEHEQELLTMGLSKRHLVVNYLIQHEQQFGQFENPQSSESGLDPYAKLTFDLAIEEAAKFTLVKEGIIRAANNRG